MTKRIVALVAPIAHAVTVATLARIAMTAVVFAKVASVVAILVIVAKKTATIPRFVVATFVLAVKTNCLQSKSRPFGRLSLLKTKRPLLAGVFNLVKSVRGIERRTDVSIFREHRSCRNNGQNQGIDKRVARQCADCVSKVRIYDFRRGNCKDLLVFVRNDVFRFKDTDESCL